MTRTRNIITATVMWCAIAGYLVIATGYSRDRRSEITVRELRITIAADTFATKVVSPAMVARWLKESDINPVGRSINDADTRAIETLVATQPEVRHVSAWSDLDGTLTVRIEPRIPLMRVRTASTTAGNPAGKYRFWFTTDGYILPDRGDFSAYVPIVTGDIPFPFGPSANGSYKNIQQENFNDFLGRFTELEAERTSLTDQRTKTRTEIRATRTKGPRRFWRERRKNAFNETKAAALVELRAQEQQQTAALAALAEKKRTLKEKEKKSYQIHGFLPKLANFVEFIERDDFWAAQIVQINVIDGERSSERGGSKSSHQPQLELVPRAGDHTVLLGALDGNEKQRLDKLRLFYLDALWYEGWHEFSYIDIRYNDQIVCRK